MDSRGGLPCVVIALLFAFCCGLGSTRGCSRKPVIFNFGDSNSDTGGLHAGLGFAVGPPNGRIFFRRPTGRFSDGRLVIDFLCERLNSAYLTPYLESLMPNFTNGANFAIAGSATLPPFVAFSLNIQVLQFLRFKSRALEINKQGFQSPLMACCGYGGLPYNFNDKVRCGQTGIVNGTVERGEACKEGANYISWDGIHYSEAANEIIASKILSTNYSDPQLSFDFFCRL